MNTSQLDPINVAILLATFLFGPVMAGVIGPYAVILIGSTVGASWSLGRREKGPRWGAAWYFLRMNATALLITVSLANLGGKWFGLTEPDWLLCPTAIAVGAIGDDWPKVFRWLMDRIAKLAESRFGGGGKP